MSFLAKFVVNFLQRSIAHIFCQQYGYSSNLLMMRRFRLLQFSSFEANRMSMHPNERTGRIKF